MQIEPATLEPRDKYRLMISSVIPRPIAWTSTIDAEGRPNLAPFSFFGGVATNPMTVMVSVGRRKGDEKDTGANLKANGEAVVHITTRPLAEQMVKTSEEAAPEVSEFELAGLTPVAAERVKPFRVAEAAIAMEAVVRNHMEVGDAPVDLFLLEVLLLHVQEEHLTHGLPDPSKLRAVGRLGGISYCDTAAPFDVTR